MQHVEGNDTRFSVEKCQHKGVGIGEFAIRYTPPAIVTEGKGKTIGLSFQCLIAGDILSDQEAMLTEVADLLNASDVGRTVLPDETTV
jgi:hypothetical protein